VHRIMRLIVMFDLPVETSADQRNYRKFKKFLHINGYAMVQYSIYSKIVMNHSALQFQKKKLHVNLPTKGHVTSLLVTEKQFANMEQHNRPVRSEEQIETVERTIEL
jgi:CRISPR-associated protein Cas2